MKNLFATAASVLVLGFAMPAMAQTSNSTVDQIGSSNKAIITQLQGPNTNTINDSDVSQDGNSNEAYVDQRGNGVGVTSPITNTSELTQTGNSNFADVKQIGGGNDTNESLALQTGDLNRANVVQGDLINNNNSDITQAGNYNTATVNQAGVNGFNTGDNTSNINQNGKNDDALVNQGGVGAVNESTINQDLGLSLFGDNYGQVTQFGSSHNISFVDQHGDGNDAFITQGAASPADNTSTTTQTGNGNYVSVTQQ